MTHYILNKGDPENPVEVEMMEWARWFETAGELRSVERTTVSTEDYCFGVSTVFLGMDHRFGPIGPPILWESMIFLEKAKDDKMNGLNNGMERYCSYRDALQGHWVMVNVVRAAVGLKPILFHVEQNGTLLFPINLPFHPSRHSKI